MMATSVGTLLVSLSAISCTESRPLSTDEWVFIGAETYGFVKNGVCEDYGMLSIHDAAECQDAASTVGVDAVGIHSDFNFVDQTEWTHPGRPTGCSWHAFGNVEQWYGTTDTCDSWGYSGCFCDDAGGEADEAWTYMGSEQYGFVKHGVCEDYGMISIRDASDCQAAANRFGQAAGIHNDFNFVDQTDWTHPGRPAGCSWHAFGNVEQWYGTTDACDSWGYSGCFCLTVECSSDRDCERYTEQCNDGKCEATRGYTGKGSKKNDGYQKSGHGGGRGGRGDEEDEEFLLFGNGVDMRMANNEESATVTQIMIMLSALVVAAMLVMCYYGKRNEYQKINEPEPQPMSQAM